MRYAIGALVALMLVMSGCADKNGQTVEAWEGGKSEPKMTTAPHDGNYALYTTPSSVPIIQPLHKGQMLGFQRREDGRMQAVGGAFSVVLRPDATKAYWKDQTKEQ